MQSFRRQLRQPRPRQHGFTMMELMIVVVIVGILASLTAPSFSQFIKSQRMKSMASDINASLTLTRSEAIKRNVTVALVPDAGTGLWQNGWQIVAPPPPPVPADPCTNTIVIEVHSAFTGITVTGPTCVAYQSSGRIRGSTAPSFNISATGVTDQRCVSVDLTGRPYMKAAAC
jgi:type IV fimbrial biogenesis protein FimT